MKCDQVYRVGYLYDGVHGHILESVQSVNDIAYTF